ncbi:LiaI-LiaF-like domain-containing protein [Melioribacteraceae bacterium 4301-Me]|uniref:LiaF transmembrane domain-containing protein n=1 Tax=Pyranulibacter aquaticus TaxID=3163344 RepID=UPI003595B242
MKSSQLFWGFFFLTIGGLFFLTRLDIIKDNLSFVWDIWPLLFILWGLQIITKNSMARPIVSGLFGIFIGLMLFGLVYNFFISINIDNENNSFATEKYSEEYDSAIKNAALELNTGAGVIILGGTTNKLIDGYSKGSFAEYNETYSKEDSSAEIKMNLRKSRFNFFRKHFKNYLRLNLNPNPTWDVKLNLGASKADLDLSEYKISNVEINTGASNIRLKLGSKQDRADIDVEMGAATLRIEIPKEVGCKITGEMVLSSKNIEGLLKKSDDHYETSDYETNNRKIDINTKGGISSIIVEQY